MHKTITIQTAKKREIIDITSQVELYLHEHKVTEGWVQVFITHTTAALTTADLDPGTDLDFLDFLHAITPKLPYRHPHNPAHAPDHIIASIIGPQVTAPVQKGELVLGTWQRIILVELDGPRNRTVVMG